MIRKVLYPAVFVLVVLMVSAAYGAWNFNTLYTLKPADGTDGRVYDQSGSALVQDGAYVQFIVATELSEMVDPLEYFGDLDNGNGVIDTPNETAECTQWLNDGADPETISGGLNKLCSTAAGDFTGEFETVGGAVDWFYFLPPWAPKLAPNIQYGMGADLIAMRVWNVTMEQLETFCTVPSTEVWYMTDREMSVESLMPPALDSGWCVGMGDIPQGGDPMSYGWAFTGVVGADVKEGLKPQNMTDTFLLECPIPEPGTMLLIGSSALLLLLRRKK